MYDDNEFHIGDIVHTRGYTQLVKGGTPTDPEFWAINVQPTFRRGSRAPEVTCFAFSPEMPAPSWPKGERPPYKLLPTLTLFLSAAHDVQIADTFYPYDLESEAYHVSATSEVRPGLLQVYGELI